MNKHEQKNPKYPRENGFLLIADMEGSTLSKHLLDEADAFALIRTHNHLVSTQCKAALPVAGIILNSLGDAVVAKFPFDADPREALASCLHAAQAIVAAFEQLEPLSTQSGRPFFLRTKILLQCYDAYKYEPGGEDPEFREELVGQDIDSAFRLAPVAWRLQVLCTEKFTNVLVGLSDDVDHSENHAQELLDQARLARHAAAVTGGPLRVIAAAYRFSSLDYWISDAREISRLKGIAEARRIFALSFESPAELTARGKQQRLCIKIRQSHHAIILVSIAPGEIPNDHYIDYVVEKLRDSTNGNRLDSELTLIAAAKIFGEYDFFFRVACIDDESLRRFFHEIRADRFGVRHVEVRSVVADRYLITRRYAQIFAALDGRSYEIVLAWFERTENRDVFDQLANILESASDEVRDVEILEIGEVIHHTPVYAIFVCANLKDYAQFFADHGLHPTACRSHVGHIDRSADAQLRYTLIDGVYIPRGLRGGDSD